MQRIIIPLYNHTGSDEVVEICDTLRGIGLDDVRVERTSDEPELAICEDKVYRVRLYTLELSSYGSRPVEKFTAEWLVRADTATDAEAMAEDYAASKFGRAKVNYLARSKNIITRPVLTSVLPVETSTR